MFNELMILLIHTMLTPHTYVSNVWSSLLLQSATFRFCSLSFTNFQNFHSRRFSQKHIIPSCHETISFGRRNTCMRVASSKFLASNSLIPYLGKIIFHASDWTAASAKKTRRFGVICFWFNLIFHSMFICIIFIYDFRQKNQIDEIELY